jgi:hypothetical protein
MVVVVKEQWVITALWRIGQPRALTASVAAVVAPVAEPMLSAPVVPPRVAVAV